MDRPGGNGSRPVRRTWYVTASEYWSLRSVTRLLVSTSGLAYSWVMPLLVDWAVMPPVGTTLASPKSLTQRVSPLSSRFSGFTSRCWVCWSMFR